MTVLSHRSSKPRRVLMTVDAVGGVWRYAMDLARGLAGQGVETVFAGLGPEPTEGQQQEAEQLGRLVWLDAPLDWLAVSEADLDRLPDQLGRLVEDFRADLVHLNLPSQACGLRLRRPVVVVSHSCVVTWFQAVRGEPVPDAWNWQHRRNREGFDAADAVVAPSGSHARMLRAAYGPIQGLEVVHNATGPTRGAFAKEPFVFAAGRWWDDGKNGAVLDQAARTTTWPVLMAGGTSGPAGQSMQLRSARQLGQLSHDRMGAMLGRAAIVASPSRYEPFGLVALEAARTGAALVLADIPTYRELWDGAALFADPRDPAAFAGAINTLAAEPLLRVELGRRAQARSERFTPEAQAEAQLSVYAAAATRFAQSHRVPA